MFIISIVIQLLSSGRLCNRMDCSTPGFPVHYQLLELAQTHVHWVSDAIQPSHPLSSPSPPALNLSQQQGLFQWVSPSHQVAKVSASASVLPLNIQDWFPLGWTDWISLQSEGLSRVFSNTTVQKHQFFGRSAFFIIQLSHPYMSTGKTMKSWKLSCLVVSDSVQPHRRQPTRLLCPWDSPGKNTWVGCHFLLQGIFPTQGPNPGLPHCRQTLSLNLWQSNVSTF